MDSKRQQQKCHFIYLKVSITEKILMACMAGSPLSEIVSRVQIVIPTSEMGVRKYIFYLVNNSFILYDGIKEIYFIDLIIFTWKKLQMEDQVINNCQTSNEIIRC